MHRWLRLKLEMGHRALAYCRYFPDSDPAIMHWVGELTRLLASADRLELEYIRARSEGAAVTARRRQLRAGLREGSLVPVVLFLRYTAELEPGGVTPWPLPRFRTDDRTFALAVRGIGEEARRAADLLARHGLPPVWAERMLTQLSEWETVGALQNECIRRRIGARAGLAAVVEEILAVGRVLDSLHRRTLAGDARRIAVWRRARHIPWPAGPRAVRATTPAPPPSAAS